MTPGSNSASGNISWLAGAAIFGVVFGASLCDNHLQLRLLEAVH